MVEAGLYDIVLAFGVEKLYHPDRERIQKVFFGSTDVNNLQRLSETLGKEAKEGQRHSIFMDIYAYVAKRYMDKSGATERHFAKIAAKNSFHGSLNPHAQFREVLTEEEVLQARMISDPLTLPMCSPIGDGAAAAVIVSPEMATKIG